MPESRALHRVQDRLVVLLGNSVEGRVSVVAGMLHRDASEATSYWLQLVVSVGIATLGLVVGSTAVVIGAMLVAPLMSPIVALAMGLATGSPFLVLRSAGRIGLSVLVAVGGAALMTLLLPFHELNAEIAARTSPTVLDLLTAAFCAMAGVYAASRPGSDTATTAAGTSIGISLVPPLCASGYGLGTLTWPVAGGAMLLFLTNLVAIVAVGTAAFAAAGFNRVDVAALEHDELSTGNDAPLARAMARRLARWFGSRSGPLLRFVMPFALLGVVYLPLRQALDEVVWELRVRTVVREALAREPGRIVQSRVHVARHGVEVVVVMLGKSTDAEDLRTRLDAEVMAASGVRPMLEVLAVPDATAFAGLESTLLTPRAAANLPVPKALTAAEKLDSAREAALGVVQRLWPSEAAGELVASDLSTDADGLPRVRLVHFGDPLPGAALESLVRAIEEKLERRPALTDVALPLGKLTREVGDLRFLVQVQAAARDTLSVAQLRLCVTRPLLVEGEAHQSDLDLARVLDEALAGHPRLTTTTGETFEAQIVQGACPEAAPPEAEGVLRGAGESEGITPTNDESTATSGD